MTASGERGSWIETRGEGGYIVSVLSPSKVHPLNKPYVQTLGPPLPELPVITPDERKLLWAAARSFDQRPKYKSQIEAAEKQLKQEARKASGITRLTDGQSSDCTAPWDDFEQRATWAEILRPHGWTQAMRFTGPEGKEFGLSAKVNRSASGAEVLTVFSTSAGPLAPANDESESFGKYRAWCLLNHSGDYSKAGKAAREAGYGK